MNLVDISSGNDSCPSRIRQCDLPIVDVIGTAAGYVPVLWIEDEDPTKRESGSKFRYVVTGLDHEPVCQTNDYDEAVAALEALPVPAPLPKSKDDALSPRFVWAIGSYREEFPDMPDDLPGLTLFDRQEKKPVLTVTEDYMQLLCLETKVAPFTRLAEWCNALPNAALESEGIEPTKEGGAS